MLRSQLCSAESLRSPALRAWAERLRPMWAADDDGRDVMLHRKMWEWLFIAEALSERGMLAAGRRGVGFGVGQEPLVALFADAGCNIDTIIQNEPLEEGRNAEVSFTIPQEDLAEAERALEPVARELGVERIDTDRQIGKVSIVGAGMRSHPGVAAKVFQTLAGEEINIEMISTSPIKISCVIRSDVVPQAVRALHSAFELGAGGIEPDGGPR